MTRTHKVGMMVSDADMGEVVQAYTEGRSPSLVNWLACAAPK